MYDGSLLPTIPKTVGNSALVVSATLLPPILLSLVRSVFVGARRSSRSWFETDCLMAVPACIVFVPHIQTFCTNEYMYMIYDGWCINYTSLYFLYIYLWYYFIGFCWCVFLREIPKIVCFIFWGFKYTNRTMTRRILYKIVNWPTSFLPKPHKMRSRLWWRSQVGFCVHYILCNVRKISLYVFHIIINSFESFGAKKKPICSPRSAFIRQSRSRISTH